jgi:hypothetical protein
VEAIEQESQAEATTNSDAYRKAWVFILAHLRVAEAHPCFLLSLHYNLISHWLLSNTKRDNKNDLVYHDNTRDTHTSCRLFVVNAPNTCTCRSPSFRTKMLVLFIFRVARNVRSPICRGALVTHWPDSSRKDGSHLGYLPGPSKRLCNHLASARNLRAAYAWQAGTTRQASISRELKSVLCIKRPHCDVNRLKQR